MTLAIMKDCLVCGRKFNIFDRKHFCSDPCAADAGAVLHDRPHKDVGRSRPARGARVRRKVNTTHSEE